MKTLVLYYSHGGHTRQLAEEVAKRCGADLEEIRPEGPRSMWRLAWQTLIRATPPVQSPTHDLGRYDLVVVGTPVWMARPPAPVRSFVQKQAARFRRVAFFCTEGGSGDKRAFAELAGLCGQSPMATLTVTEKQLPEAAHREQLTTFAASLAA
jgi:flavodoxin